MSDPTTIPSPGTVPGAANGSKTKQRAMPTRKEKQDISIMEVRGTESRHLTFCANIVRRRTTAVLPPNEVSKKSTTKTIMAFYDTSSRSFSAGRLLSIVAIGCE
jgi:hypothetical protein